MLVELFFPILKSWLILVIMSLKNWIYPTPSIIVEYIKLLYQPIARMRELMDEDDAADTITY